MVMIRVCPESLHTLAAALEQTATGLRAAADQARGRYACLDWQARSRAGVEGQVAAVRQQAEALASSAEGLAHFLRAKAEAFAAADQQGAGAWPALPLSGSPVLLPARLPWPLAGLSFLALGFIRLPGLTWPPAVQLRSLLFGSSNTPIPGSDAGEGTTTRAAGQGSFADLLPKPAAPVTQPVAPPTVAVQGTWGVKVPPYGQRGLHMPGGQGTLYGCTPTAASMVLAYWHQQDPANKALSAQELVDANAQQGEFSANRGMSVTALYDEVRAAGYAVVEDHTNAGPADLQAAVAQGPVIALVKLGLGTTGQNHSVVVTGISPDGQQVRINDPWDAGTHTYAWGQFARSWGADFGPGAPENVYTVIRP